MNDADFRAIIAGLEHRGLSRTEIAARAGLSRMTVWKFANGMARNPSHYTVEKLISVAAKENVAVYPKIQIRR